MSYRTRGFFVGWFGSFLREMGATFWQYPAQSEFETVG
jgi:hypothetical protein